MRGRHGRVRAGDVPGVDDDTTGFVSGVIDELQAVVQRLDVRPGEELDPQPCADILRLGRELGELRGPAPAVPGAVVTVGGDLDVPGAERFRRLEQAVPDPIRLLLAGARRPTSTGCPRARGGRCRCRRAWPGFRSAGIPPRRRADRPRAGRSPGSRPPTRPRSVRAGVSGLRRSGSVGGSVTCAGPTGGHQFVGSAATPRACSAFMSGLRRRCHLWSPPAAVRATSCSREGLCNITSSVSPRGDGGGGRSSGRSRCHSRLPRSTVSIRRIVLTASAASVRAGAPVRIAVVKASSW